MSVSFQAMGSNFYLKSNIIKVISFIGCFFLILFPFSITVLHHVHGVVIVLSIIMFVMLYFLAEKQSQLDKNERYLVFSIVYLVLAIFTVTAYSGIDEVVMKKLSKFVYLLLIIPVYFFYKRIKVSYSLVWYGLVIGSLVSGVYGVNQVMKTPAFDVLFSLRAKGVTNAIIYGDISLLLGAMSLAGLGWFKAKSKWHILLPITACIVGVLASALSQSRGGWVAIPFLSLILIWYSRAYVSKHIPVLGVLSVIGVMAIIYLVPQTGVESKLNTTVSNIQLYLNSDVDSSDRQTSIGVRLESWKAAWYIFLDNPLIGVGWGSFQDNAKLFVDKGVIHKSATIFAHPHNQYLSALANGGIVVGVGIILLFFVPMRMFYKACDPQNKNADSRRIALAGLVFMVGFAIFNLSESFLERSRTVSFFIFYLAVFMAGIRHSNNNASDN